MNDKLNESRGPLSRTALQALAGQEIGVSAWHEIAQSRIDAFADATEDWQFIHTDAARAASESPFGGTIAHGFLSLSMLSVFASEAMPPILDVAITINYGLDKVRFLAPVRCGARIRGHFVLAEAAAQDGHRLRVRYSVSVEIEAMDRPALVAEWLALYEFNH
jgi:acyl dehydratase